MRRVVRILLAVLAVAVLLPLAVMVGAKVGLPTRHWTGVQLADVESPLDPHPDAMPEAAARLLDAARRQEESDTGDLAPSWWDAGAGEVVLGAVTDRGEELRRSLGSRIERRARSARELARIQDDAISLGRGIFMTYVDAERDQIIVTSTSLSHALFADLAARYGDAVAVVDSPLSGPGQLDEPPVNAPSQWSRANPVGTWFTLTTGFPWYAGTVLVLTALLWFVQRRRGRPSPTTAAPAASTSV